MNDEADALKTAMGFASGLVSKSLEMNKSYTEELQARVSLSQKCFDELWDLMIDLMDVTLPPRSETREEFSYEMRKLRERMKGGK